MKFGRLQILAFIFFLACPSLLAQESVLMKALRDELGRTMEKLQLEDMERPYFVAYWVQETNSLRIEASLGGLLGNRKASNRYLSRNRRAPMMMRGAMREPQVEPAILAYKLLPDGREELIQKVALSGFSESSFRDIVAASDLPMKYDTEFQRRARGFSMLFDFSAGGSFGTPLVSLVTPSLLFEDLTLKRPTEAIPRPPVTPPPARGQ